LALGCAFAATLVGSTASAEERVFERKSPRDPNDIIYGGRGVSERSGVAGVCSLLVPGVGQAINKNRTPKVVTHLVIGLLPYVAWFSPLWPIGGLFGLFHIWSAWDALIDRPGGYINGAVLAPGAGEWQDASTGTAAPVG
jgi:hypothetical protein